jgi:hypothetical protein
VAIQYFDAWVLMFLVLSNLFFVVLIQRIAKAVTYKANLLCLWIAMMTYGLVKMATVLAAVLDRPHVHEYSLVLLLATTGAMLWCARGLKRTGEEWGRAPAPTDEELLSSQSRYAALRTLLLGR